MIHIAKALFVKVYIKEKETANKTVTPIPITRDGTFMLKNRRAVKRNTCRTRYRYP